jgi:membrane associated rhomboid family serine protease
MHSAPVGHQCADCIQAAGQTVAVAAPARVGGLPVVTYGLIAINVAVFIFMLANPQLNRDFTLWAPAVASGEYYRLVTSAFMHSGIAHIAFNMWALYVLGPPLERHLGRLRYGSLYVLSLLGGSVLVYLLSPLNAGTVGASGAIFGLFGATFVASRKLHLDVRWLVGLIVINLAMTFSLPGISWQGHIGGLITGGVLAAAYVYAPAERRTATQVGATIALLLLFVVLIAWRTSELLQRYPELSSGLTNARG